MAPRFSEKHQNSALTVAIDVTRTGIVRVPDLQARDRTIAARSSAIRRSDQWGAFQEAMTPRMRRSPHRPLAANWDASAVVQRPVLARRRNRRVSDRKLAFMAESEFIVLTLSFVARDPEQT